MRISVDFFVDQNIPLAYRLMMISIFKEAVKKGDPYYFQQLYIDDAANPKPYTFAIRFHKFDLQDDFILTDGFRLLVSSDDYGFLIPFLNGLQKTSLFRYKEFELERRSIRYLQDYEVKSSKIVFHTLSPVLMEDEFKKPLTPLDSNYNDHLNAVTNRMLQTHLGRLLHEKIKLIPLDIKKTVIKEKYDTEHPDRYLYFTAYSGKMMLEGHPEDLNYLLKYGIGLRSSQSFGMLELLKEVR